MLALMIAIGATVMLPILIGYELHRRKNPRMKEQSPRAARRLVYLEARVHEALENTKTQFGEIFTSYKVWKVDKETRLELQATPKWKRLSEFTRCLIVRHLWRSLEAVAQGSVVVVDDPPMEWTREINLSFRDRGVDPWRAHPLYAAGGPPRYKR